MSDRLKVKHIRTSQFGKDPSASTIDYGEIAINYNSGSTALYIRDNADNIVKFANRYAKTINGRLKAEDGISVNNEEGRTHLSAHSEQKLSKSNQR